MSLKTGRRIHGYIWNELPIPDHMIRRVEKLADDKNAMNLDDDGCPIFEWELGEVMPDEEPEDDAVEPEEGPAEQDQHDCDEEDEEESDHSDDETEEEEDPGDESGDDEFISDEGGAVVSNYDDMEDQTNSTDDEPADSSDMEVNESDESDGEGNTDEGASSSDEDVSDNDGDESSEEEDSDTRSEDLDVEETTETRSEGGARVERNRSQPNQYEPSFKGKSYGTSMMNITLNQVDRIRSVYSTAVNVLFNQMTATKGLKMFGEGAVAAMFKEYKQLDNMKVFGGRAKSSDLTTDNKRRALRAINLIKEQRCRKIKGRTCADGRPQRAYTPREEASSPTIALESLMATLLIDTHEERDVAIFDVPGAYLHAKLPEDKFVLLQIEGPFVDIMCEVNPEYKEDVMFEGTKKVLYVQILQALYGMIESALLWYSLYIEVLEKEGFLVNEYDKCVANKMIEGKQCTLAFYVDDNKLSHVSSKVVDDVLDTIEGYFPGLVTERGKCLNFLGMEIEFIGDKKIAVGTVQYIKAMIVEFGEELLKKVSSPAAKWLFVTDEKSPKLSGEQADKFVKFVSKLLWVMKRSRPDIETSISSFLCTPNKGPDKDDWCKLVRVMSWLKQTVEDVRIIGADDLHGMLTFIDSAHAVHPNMCGNTGGLTTFGTGIIDQKSGKQKMNTRSSTKTEVVGTSEYLPKNIYFEMFMEAQGYKLKINVLAEENESTIRMSNNGRDSCTSNSKHIAIKYFWVTKNRIKNGNIAIVHCPTKQMVADYFTKPLQGASLFHMFQNVIMGWAHISTVYTGYAASERVGNSKKKVKCDNNVNVNRKAYTKDELVDAPAHKPLNKTKSYAEAVNSQNKIVMKNRDKAYGFNEGGVLIKLKQSSFK